jgi:hypothetical protein
VTTDRDPQPGDVGAGEEAPRDLAWLDQPTCEELAWLEHLRLRVAARKSAAELRSEARAQAPDARLLKHR